MMNNYRLLEDQGEPGCEYLQTRPLLQDSRNSRPLLNAIFIFETALLILSIAGNGFQYWSHHRGATDDGWSEISELDVPNPDPSNYADIDLCSRRYCRDCAAVRDSHRVE